MAGAFAPFVGALPGAALSMLKDNGTNKASPTDVLKRKKPIADNIVRLASPLAALRGDRP